MLCIGFLVCTPEMEKRNGIYLYDSLCFFISYWKREFVWQKLKLSHQLNHFRHPLSPPSFFLDSLGILTECFIQVGSAMFGATINRAINLVTPCRTIKIFWKLKDCSLKINSSSLNNCFSSRNVLQNGVNVLSKTVKNRLLMKNSKFCTFQIKRFGSNSGSILSNYVSNNVWRDLRLSVPVITKVARKSFKGKFNAKNWFFKRAFHVTITDPDIGSLI